LGFAVDRYFGATILGNDFSLGESSKLLHLEFVKLVRDTFLERRWRGFAA
jgi:hypothetical protein